MNDIDSLMCQKGLLSSAFNKMKSVVSRSPSCSCEKAMPENKCSPYINKRVQMDHCNGHFLIVFSTKSANEVCPLTKEDQRNLSGHALEEYYRKTLDLDDSSVFKVADADCYRGEVDNSDKKQIPAQYYYFLNKLRAGSLAAIRQSAAADLSLGSRPFSSGAFSAQNCPVEGLPQTKQWCASMSTCSEPPKNPATGHTEMFDQMVKELETMQLVHRQLKEKQKYLHADLPEYKAIQKVIDNLEANYPALKDRQFLTQAYTGKKVAAAYEAYLGRVKERSQKLLEQFRRATDCLRSRNGGQTFDTPDCKEFDKAIASAPDFDGEMAPSRTKSDARNSSMARDYAFNTECRVKERDRISDENANFLKDTGLIALSMGASAVTSLGKAGVMGLEEGAAALINTMLRSSGTAAVGASNISEKVEACRKFSDKISAPPFSMGNAGAPPSCINMQMPELAKARDCYGDAISGIASQVLLAAANRLAPGASSEARSAESNVVATTGRTAAGSVTGSVSGTVERSLENSLQRLGSNFLQAEKNGAAQTPEIRLSNLFRAARNGDIRDGEAINRRILQIAGKVDKPTSAAAAAMDPFFKYRKVNSSYKFTESAIDMARSNYVEPAKSLFQSFRSASDAEKKEILMQMSHYFCLVTQFENMAGMAVTRPGELDLIRSALNSGGGVTCR